MAFAAPVICNRIKVIETDVNSKIAFQQRTINNTYKERVAALTKQERDYSRRMDELRYKRDVQLKERYAPLEDLTSTPEQQAALETFRQKISSAVVGHRLAIDSATTGFRSGVMGVLNERREMAQNILNQLKTNIQNAFSKARTDCSSGVPFSIVRTELKASIASALETYSSQRRAIKPIKPDLDALRVERKKAVKQAGKTFRQEVEKAKKEFKQSI